MPLQLLSHNLIKAAMNYTIYLMRPNVPNLNVAVTGHVDHGKSTLVGSLLVNWDQIEEYEYENLKREAEDRGRSDEGLAYISDDRLEERERGLSIKPSYNQLLTDEFNFTLVDCPGHQYYMRNMIRGVSQCDASVLAVSATEGIQTITKEHALISSVMGGEDIFVVVTKMDEVEYNENTFTSIKSDVNDLFDTIPTLTKSPDVLPVSATKSKNILPSDEGIEWFEGLSLLEKLNSLSIPPEVDDLPLRLPIDEKHTMSGIGTTVTGTVRSGNLKSDQKVHFEPSGSTCTIRSMEMHHEPIGRAISRDSIGLNLTGAPTGNIESGEVCGPVDQPPTVGKEISVEINVVNKPPAIKPGIKLSLHAHATHSPCEVTGVREEEDSSNKSTMGKLTPGDSGMITVELPEEIAIEPVDRFNALGKIILRDNNKTIGYGDVSEVK